MKRIAVVLDAVISLPAAFGRLCVETATLQSAFPISKPAAFGRLCVETMQKEGKEELPGPAAFGRLCVETPVSLRL